MHVCVHGMYPCNYMYMTLSHSVTTADLGGPEETRCNGPKAGGHSSGGCAGGGEEGHRPGQRETPATGGRGGEALPQTSLHQEVDALI